MSFHALV